MSEIIRVQSIVDAVCPGVSVVKLGPGSFTLQFDGSETAEQRSAAEAALAGLDISPDAVAAWEREQRRAAAVELLNSPDPVMVAVRALATVVKRRVGVLLTALGQQPLTTAQLIELWADCIADGEVDETIPTNGH